MEKKKESFAEKIKSIRLSFESGEKRLLFGLNVFCGL